MLKEGFGEWLKSARKRTTIFRGGPKLLLAPQRSGAHSRGAFRDFQLMDFEHLSLYMQKPVSGIV